MLFEPDIQQALDSNDHKQQLRVLRAVLKYLPPVYCKYVLAAAVALCNHEGFTTPAEEFIYSVLHAYMNNGRFMKPDDIEPDVEEFREHWGYVKSMVERFAPMFERQQAAA